MDLSNEIRRRIADDPRTVSALAREAGLHQQTLQRFATGERDLSLRLTSQLLPILGGKIEWKKLLKKD